MLLTRLRYLDEYTDGGATFDTDFENGIGKTICGNKTTEI